MKKYSELIEEILPEIREVFPWDMEELEQSKNNILLLDTREPYEFDAMRIEGSINVPRGILETACEWGFEETEPELVEARERPVLVICRSGNRSALAAYTMQQLGYRDVYSLKTGLRGWNDYELPLIDNAGNRVDPDAAEEFFAPNLRPEQMPPEQR